MLYRSLPYDNFCRYYCFEISREEFSALVEAVDNAYKKSTENRPSINNVVRPLYNEIISSTIVAHIFAQMANIQVLDSDTKEQIQRKFQIQYSREFPLDNQFLTESLNNLSSIEKQILQIESRIIWKKLCKLRANQLCKRLEAKNKIAHDYEPLIEKGEIAKLSEIFTNPSTSKYQQECLAKLILQKRYQFVNNPNSRTLFGLVLRALSEKSDISDAIILPVESAKLLGASMSAKLRVHVLACLDEYKELKTVASQCCGEQMWCELLQDNGLQDNEEFICKMLDILPPTRSSEISNILLSGAKSMAKPVLIKQLNLIGAGSMKLADIPYDRYRPLLAVNMEKKILSKRKLLDFFAPYGHAIFNHRIMSALNPNQFVLSNAISPVMLLFPTVIKFVTPMLTPGPQVLSASIAISFLIYEMGVIFINLGIFIASILGICHIESKDLKVFNPPDWVTIFLDNVCNVGVATNNFNFKLVSLPFMHLFEKKVLKQGRGDEILITDHILPIVNLMLLLVNGISVLSLIEGTTTCFALAMIKSQARVWIGLMDNVSLQSHIAEMPGPARVDVPPPVDVTAQLSHPIVFPPIPMPGSSRRQ